MKAECERIRNKDRLSRSRSEQSQCEAEKERSQNKERISRKRSKQSQCEAEREKKLNKERISRSRSKLTEAEVQEERLRDKERKKTKRTIQVNTEEKRLTSFRASVKDGRIYECVVCHRKLFRTSVNQIQTSFESDIEEQYPGLFSRAIGDFETKPINDMFYMCMTCNSYLKKGKIPPMSHKNSLQLLDITGYGELHLTEVENCMISLNIIFQKLV